jgi:hypothetical protein
MAMGFNGAQGIKMNIIQISNTPEFFKKLLDNQPNER